MKKIKLLLSGILLIMTSALVAQNTEEHVKEANHGMKGANRLTLGLGHTQVSHGEVNGDTKWLSITS